MERKLIEGHIIMGLSDLKLHPEMCKLNAN